MNTDAQRIDMLIVMQWRLI